MVVAAPCSSTPSANRAYFNVWSASSIHSPGSSQVTICWPFLAVASHAGGAGASRLSRSEVNRHHRHVDRRVRDPHRGNELLVGQPREEPVDGALEVGDEALGLVGEAHELEAAVVQPPLLLRNVREVLSRDRWPSR